MCIMMLMVMNQMIDKTYEESKELFPTTFILVAKVQKRYVKTELTGLMYITFIGVHNIYPKYDGTIEIPVNNKTEIDFEFGESWVIAIIRSVD